MKSLIKVNDRIYYLYQETWEKEKQFLKSKEIEFTKNVRKLWHSLIKLKST